jgi:hypothetical protein
VRRFFGAHAEPHPRSRRKKTRRKPYIDIHEEELMADWSLAAKGEAIFPIDRYAKAISRNVYIPEILSRIHTV